PDRAAGYRRGLGGDLGRGRASGGCARSLPLLHRRAQGAGADLEEGVRARRQLLGGRAQPRPRRNLSPGPVSPDLDLERPLRAIPITAKEPLHRITRSTAAIAAGLNLL